MIRPLPVALIGVVLAGCTNLTGPDAQFRRVEGDDTGAIGISVIYVPPCLPDWYEWTNGRCYPHAQVREHDRQ